MKISTRGRYGIRLMLALALNYNNGTIPLKTIAKDQGISEKYLEQIINPLTKSGSGKKLPWRTGRLYADQSSRSNHRRRDTACAGRLSVPCGLC